MLYAVTQDEAGATEVHKGFDSLQRSPDPTLTLSSFSLCLFFYKFFPYFPNCLGEIYSLSINLEVLKNTI